VKRQACLLAMLCVAVAIGPAALAEGGADWSYHGSDGPEFWGALSADYEMCDVGRMQSPVDLKGAVKAGLENIRFKYKKGPVRIQNTGHSLQVNVEDGSYMWVANTRYGLVNYNFHSPAEHPIDGFIYPMEMHFVHRTASGQVAVVAVFFEVGKPNKHLELIFGNMPREQIEVEIDGAKFNPSKLKPTHSRDYYRYKGSLTTPPCTEGVTWVVMQDTQQASETQMDLLRLMFGGNSRPLQQLNNRLLVLDK
jgi:carbonic anhydrase